MPREPLSEFLFNVQKWRGSKSVQRMSFSERGVYFEMMLEQWEKRFLPDDAAQVAERLALTSAQIDEVLSAWPVVRLKFATDDRGKKGIVNIALERTRRDQKRKLLKRSEAGKIAGKASAAKRLNHSDLDTNERSTDVQRSSTVRLGMDRIGKDRLGKDRKGSDRIGEGREGSEDQERSPVGLAFAHYHAKFLERYHAKPEYAGAKDGKRWKALVSKHGLDEVKRRLDGYFASPDAWIQRTGHTLDAFFSAGVQTKLVAELSGQGSGFSDTARHNRAASDQAEQLILDNEVHRAGHR